MYFSSVGEGRGSNSARHSKGGVEMTASLLHWARCLGTTAMFHLGGLAPTQPHFLYLHAHLYLTTAGRWLKAPFYSGNNSLCKIESWLWADVNHSNLAHTLVMLEGVLCRIWMHFGGCQGVDCCSDRQADAQRDKQKGHRKRQADKKLGGRQTADRKRYMVKKKVIIFFATYFIFFISSSQLNIFIGCSTTFVLQIYILLFHYICYFHFFGNVRNPLLFQ